jgi:hypothetical protein
MGALPLWPDAWILGEFIHCFLEGLLISNERKFEAITGL